MENDRSIAELLAMIARHYQKQIQDVDIPKNKTCLDVIRKLELVSQGIKGLMKHEQEAF